MTSPEAVFQQILAALPQVLTDAKSGDPRLREPAERSITEWTNNFFPVFVMALAHETANEEKKNSPTRLLAALLLKVCLDGREQASRDTAHRRWLETDRNIRGHIKQMSLTALRSQDPSVRSFAAQVVAKIALIELPHNQWENLIEMLLGNMTVQQVPSELRQSTLETVGYICEEINPDVLAPSADKLLTAIIQGMRPDETNPTTKLNATKALSFALALCHKNFENERERKFILDVVIETAGNSASPAIRKAAMECLVQIASLYYEFLTQHVQSIFMITWKAIKEDEEDVALQAVEFWSTICDEELSIIEQIEEGVFKARKCHYFIKSAVEYLAPVLTASLTKGDDVPSDDPDAWNISMAASTCLNLIANVSGDAVVPHVLPFVQQHFTSANAKYREAATLAFGSILEGPKDIQSKIIVALPTLLDHMRDPDPAVKDTTAWTLGRIAQRHIQSLAQIFPRFVDTIIGSLNDPEPRVVSNVCWTINNLAEAFPRTLQNHPLNQYFVPICQGLIRCADRPDAGDANLRSSAYETLNAVILSASNDIIQSVGQLVPVFIDRLEKTFAFPILSKDDKELQSELQGLTCGILQTLTIRLESQIGAFADKMMVLYLRLFHQKGANSLHEEALLAVGALINALDREFEKYMKEFHQFLLAGLANTQDYHICTVAVGIVSDLARALGKNLINYSDHVVMYLLQNLQKGELNRSVKPVILSAFGDIALALEGQFAEKYLVHVMEMLKQAAATAMSTRLDSMPEQDFDLIDYMNQLREGIFEAYAGIIQGLNAEGKAEMLLPYSHGILALIHHITEDKARTEEVCRAAVGVLGDLAHTLGTKIQGVDMRTHFNPLIDHCRSPKAHPTTQSTAEWTRETIDTYWK